MVDAVVPVAVGRGVVGVVAKAVGHGRRVRHGAGVVTHRQAHARAPNSRCLGQVAPPCSLGERHRFTQRRLGALQHLGPGHDRPDVDGHLTERLGEDGARQRAVGRDRRDLLVPAGYVGVVPPFDAHARGLGGDPGLLHRREHAVAEVAVAERNIPVLSDLAMVPFRHHQPAGTVPEFVRQLPGGCDELAERTLEFSDRAVHQHLGHRRVVEVLGGDLGRQINL